MLVEARLCFNEAAAGPAILKGCRVKLFPQELIPGRVPSQDLS